MTHNLSLITTIAAALGLALIFGFVCTRIRIPALVGYLLAGVVIGPATPGFVADVSLAGQLAEIGVMLLMFGVGLHFSLDDLLSVRAIAVPGALVQIVVATAMGAGVALLWGWSPAEALVFGMCLSVASTVVLLRALEQRGMVESMVGRIAVGWLVVEDLVMVIVLVLLPALASVLGIGEPGAAAGAVSDGAAVEAVRGMVGTGTEPLWLTLLMTVARVGIFVGLMLVVGRRIFPWLLWQIARTGSQELFTLCVVVAAVGIAYAAAALFGVSFALGAFFAGMVLRGSALSHRAAQETLPLRDAFAVLFFVSVGMLFDPRVLVEEPLHVLATVAIILVGKSMAACALVLLMRYPLRTALTVSASLAQIGEFSFILASLGMTLGMLPSEGQSLVLAGAVISIGLNALVFRMIGPLQDHVVQWPAFRRLARRDDPLAELPASTPQSMLSRQVVVVGYGRLGARIGDALKARGVPFVVAEQNREIVERLRAAGVAAVSGDAADPGVLIQAHIARAGVLVTTIDDTVAVRQMVEVARTLNPGIQCVVRTQTGEGAALLSGERVGRILVVEDEVANAMERHVLDAVREGQRQLADADPGHAASREAGRHA